MRNTTSHSSRRTVIAQAALAIGLAQSFLLSWAWVGLQQDLNQLRLAGRNVVVIGAAEEGAPTRIDVQSCEALTDVGGVARAGVLIDLQRESFVQLGPLVPVRAASETLFPELETNGYAIGADLGLSGSLLLALPDGSSAQATVLRPDVAGLDVDSSVLVPATNSLIEAGSCIVELERDSTLNDLSGVVSAALSSSGGPVSTFPVLNETYDVVDAYLQRPDRFSPLLAGVFGALLSALLVRLRGSELAAYRFSGTSRVDLARLLLLEETILAGLFVAGSSLGLFPAIILSGMPASSLLWAWVGGGAWMIGAGLVGFVATRSNPMDQAKDR